MRVRSSCFKQDTQEEVLLTANVCPETERGEKDKPCGWQEGGSVSI